MQCAFYIWIWENKYNKINVDINATEKFKFWPCIKNIQNDKIVWII